MSGTLYGLLTGVAGLSTQPHEKSKVFRSVNFSNFSFSWLISICCSTIFSFSWGEKKKPKEKTVVDYELCTMFTISKFRTKVTNLINHSLSLNYTAVHRQILQQNEKSMSYHQHNVHTSTPNKLVTHFCPGRPIPGKLC